MTYPEAIGYLEALNTFGVRLGLGRVRRLLELLGQPQRCYKTIHVTGTNGKGSTTAMLSAILHSSGVKTGMYTSPHLSEYTERIQVGGRRIDQRQFADLVFKVGGLVERMIAGGEESPTQFEVLTAAAFAYFAQQKVEYAVIEVGLGGLLDSTNVITPELALITNVTMDHADRCGGTLAGVAEHKAGVIKPQAPVVTAAAGAPLSVIRAKAAAQKARLLVKGEDFNAQFDGMDADGRQVVRFTAAPALEARYPLQLLGVHQVENSAVAVMAAQLLARMDSRVTEASIAAGLANVRWPGRLEIVARAPLTVIDGAHNLAGAAALRENLDRYFGGRRRVLLLGILQDKDVDGILAQIVRPEDTVVVTRPDSERAAAPEAVAAKIAARRVETAPAIEDALAAARRLTGPEDLLCVAGSLYLIGKVRKLICDQVNSDSR